MSRVFADTAFFVAFLSERDEHHAAALHYMAEPKTRVITTGWVLAELGNFLASGMHRTVFVALVEQLFLDERFDILPADATTFRRALRLYGERDDKRWSFTDCTSFLAMKGHRITSALTSDHHFEQAGFAIPLK